MIPKANPAPQAAPGAEPPSDAMVIFGVTGDLAHKNIFPADSLNKAGAARDPAVVDRRLSLLTGVCGHHDDPATFTAINLGAAGLAEQARELSRIAQLHFAERAIFRIDDYLSKAAGALRDVAQNHLVRGQYAGFRNERDAVTTAEVLVQLKPPPQALFEDSAPADGHANYFHFRPAPTSSIALAARVERAGKGFVGGQHERFNHPPVVGYEQGTWGPSEADALTAGAGVWHNPAAEMDCP